MDSLTCTLTNQLLYCDRRSGVLHRYDQLRRSVGRGIRDGPSARTLSCASLPMVISEKEYVVSVNSVRTYLGVFHLHRSSHMPFYQ